MAVLTPIANSRFDNVSGSQRQVIAKFTSIATGDTWPTGLAVITGVNFSAGDAKVTFLTASGGTVTFTVASGPTVNCFVDATGF